jgi:hypothetical protein
MNAGRSAATVTLDTSKLGGAVKAIDALEGGESAWSGTVTLQLPASSGKVFRLVR